MKSPVMKPHVLKSQVSVLMGSRSDLPVVGKAAAVLREFGVPCEVRVLSAHRTPESLAAYVRQAEAGGVEVFIAAAGMAAHLAGAVAARTVLPVIGVPLAAPAGAAGLGGLDALLSTVQMPPGIPVATVGVDAAKNAAYLAVSILALKHPELGDKLRAYREKLAAGAAAASEVTGEELAGGGAALGGSPAAHGGDRAGGPQGGVPS